MPISARPAWPRSSASAEGGTGAVAAPTGDAQLLFKVTEVFEPAGADASSVPEDAQKSFASGIADDLLDQLVAKLQSEYGVDVDQPPIARWPLTTDERAESPYRQGRRPARALLRGGARGLRHHHVGRSDARPDRRLPDGAAGARRDGRRDFRRGRHDARQDAARRGAGRRDRHRRHRRRRLAQRQHLDRLGLRHRRRRRAGRQARQPRPVLADRRGRRADGARRQDRLCRRKRSAAASAKPASASCSRRRIIRR